MTITLTKLKRMLSIKQEEPTASIIETKSFVPEVGFKVFYSGTNNEITVKVLGARHLPTTFGVKNVSGYFVKVKLFPGTAKYETQTVSQSWPMFNEKFKFKVHTPSAGSGANGPLAILNGHFLTFTVYADLGDPEKRTVRDQTKDTYKSFKRTVDTYCNTLAQQAQGAGGGKSGSKDKNRQREGPMRVSADKRRTVGTVTWSADARTLRETTTNRQYETLELWRPMKEMGNGAVASRRTMDTRKGQIEIALSYGPPRQPPTPLTPVPPATEPRTPPPTPDTAPPSTSSTFIRSAMTRLSLRKSLLPLTVAEEPRPPVANPFDRVYTSRAANPFDSDEDDSNGEDEDGRADRAVGKVLTVRTLRVRCSAQVKDRLEAAGGHLYLKTYILDDDRKLRSWRTPKFKPALSNHLDPALSSISMVIPESDLEYTAISITLFNKNGLKERVALGTVRIGAGAKNKSCLDHWNNVLEAQGEEVTQWQSIE